MSRNLSLSLACLLAVPPRLEAATAFHATRVDANGLVVTNDPDYWQTSQSGEVTEYSLAYYELLQNMIWLEGQDRDGGEGHRVARHQTGRHAHLIPHGTR